MILAKGQLIQEVACLYQPDGTLESERVLVYRVDRVNPKTYTITCVEGCIKGSACRLRKDFDLRREEKSLGWLTVIEKTLL